MKRGKIAMMAMLFQLVNLGVAQAANNVNRIKPIQLFSPNIITPTAQLLYYGGPVIPNVQVNAVFWGPSVDPTVKANIASFYTAVMASTYMDWLTEYNTNIKAVNGNAGTNQIIGRGTFAGQYTITPVNTATTIDDVAIRVELQDQINAGHLPPPTNSTLYMLHFPKGTTITMQGSTSCEEFCAYHGGFHPTANTNVFYGVMPDFSDGICPTGCGTNATTFDNFTSAASHEVIETVTDCQVDDAAGNVAAPLAWYDTNNGEIGDICNQVAGSITASDGTKYTVQGQWSNKRNSCVWAP